MNIRQLKRMHYSRATSAAILFGQLGRGQSHFVPGYHRGDGTVIGIDSLKAMIEPSPAGMQMLAVQKAVVLFVCHKVKDDEVVGEFNTREEALAMVIKHSKQKKAKLYVMHDGAPVLFAEEEMAA